MKKLSSERHGLPVIQDRAAGIDIGSRFHVVAVPTDLTDMPVRTFQAFTADLEQMADQSGARTVEDEDCMRGSLPQAWRRDTHTCPAAFWKDGLAFRRGRRGTMRPA